MRVRVLTGLKRCRRCHSAFPVVWVDGVPLDIVGDEVHRVLRVESLILRDGPNGMRWTNVCPVCGTDHGDDYLRADHARGDLSDVRSEEMDLDVRCVLCGRALDHVISPDHAVCEDCIGDLRYLDRRKLEASSRRSVVRRLRDVRREIEHGGMAEDVVDSAIAAELRAIRAIESRSNVNDADRPVIVVERESTDEYADVFDYVEEVRGTYPRTLYEWTPLETRRLSSMRRDGLDAHSIGDALERAPGEVRHVTSAGDGSEKVPRGPPIRIAPSANERRRDDGQVVRALDY